MRLLGPGGGEQRSCPGDGQCNLTDLSTEAAMTEDRLGDYEAGSPTRMALNVLAHKWTLLIVLALKRGPLRFTRLRALVPGVTSQVLRDSLRELERDGIVDRQAFVAVPPRVEYSLTARLGKACASRCAPSGPGPKRTAPPSSRLGSASTATRVARGGGDGAVRACPRVVRAQDLTGAHPEHHGRGAGHPIAFNKPISSPGRHAWTTAHSRTARVLPAPALLQHGAAGPRRHSCGSQG